MKNDGWDLFYEKNLRGKTEEEILKIKQDIIKKIESLEKEVNLKWKYDSHQMAENIIALGKYRDNLVSTNVALADIRGERDDNKPCELTPLIEILKASQKEKPKSEEEIDWEDSIE